MASLIKKREVYYLRYRVDGVQHTFLLNWPNSVIS